MRALAILFLLVALSLAACGGAAAPTTAPTSGAAGDPVAGKQIFESGTTPACTSCHSTTAGQVIIGPSLSGISAKGEAFIRQCITNPSSVNVPGFTHLMPTNFAQQLSAQQLNDLIAYLMTLP